ncbi:hypothetical protein [Tsukamurella tyrosinosolvens]|uniref:hypothetical protein n=1 Tax=Tsukamurella tyrosinosolvens TaxID=57704 RepID=UPI0007923035|nr:hypothetical protein [Tsukamurella tyrosinosolvens]KXP08855.1 hypothetical protein AXK59_00065 [Tsukamurella tyrosinosolvens]KZL97083.1 hypothetical protein AXX05_16605 [Tsukamurella tyrosinosolvens]
MATTAQTVDGFDTLSDDEYDSLFDRIVRKNMGISAAEFLARWDRGDYQGRDWDSVSGLRAAAMALPLVRSTPVE